MIRSALLCILLGLTIGAALPRPVATAQSSDPCAPTATATATIEPSATATTEPSATSTATTVPSATATAVPPTATPLPTYLPIVIYRDAFGPGWSRQAPGGWTTSWSMASVSEVASPVHEGARAWRLVYQGWGGFQLMANPPVNLDGTLIFAIQGAGRFQVYLQHAGGTYTANTVTATPAWTVYRLALPAGGLVGVTELTFKETENAARTIILDSIAVEPASAPASTPTGTPAPPTATQAPASSPTRTPTPPAGGGALRIMPLGDSITEGVNGGYRDVLQSRLAAAVIAYDLVGPRSDGYANGPDKDHAGTPGFNTGDILREINGYLATYDPDVVLLMIGTNDLAWWTNALPSEIAANVATIIDRIEASGARVILATTPPISNANVPPTGRSRSAMLRDYNAALRALAAARGLTLVDVEAVLTLSNLYDGIHPDETAHDQLIAPLWAEALGA